MTPDRLTVELAAALRDLATAANEIAGRVESEEVPVFVLARLLIAVNEANRIRGYLPCKA